MSFKPNFKLLKGIPLFALLASMFLVAGGCDDEDVKARILANIGSKVFDIYDGDTGQVVSFNLYPDKEYIMAVNTAGMETAGNVSILYFKNFRGYEATCRLVKFRLDPAAEEEDFISVLGTPDNLKMWRFTIPDQQLHQENGVLKLFMKYKRIGSPSTMYAYDYYNLIDSTPDSAKIVNSGPAVKDWTVNIGYMGTAKTDEEIADLVDKIREHFSYAAKDYSSMSVNYIGRQPFPEDNADVAGRVHDYSSWWASVSHDLAGTDLLPLDPDIPEEFEMIKLAWYDVRENRAQLNRDIRALFGLPLGDRTIIIVEGSYWAAGGGSFATVPMYNPYGFEQDGQYGLHENFAFLPEPRVLKIALHEFGHLFGMTHPSILYTPGEEDWTVRVSPVCVLLYADLMHQGGLDDYPTDVFYNDSDIGRLIQPELDIDAINSLEIPFVEPVGDPINSADLTISGKKLAGASITVNGAEAVPATPGTSWVATLSLDAGVNRFEIAQESDDDTSHPYILFVSRGEELMPVVPALELEKLIPAADNVRRGGIITFEIRAQALSGLKAVWWWAEKENADGEYEQVREVGHWHNLHGASEARVKYHISFPEPGSYKIRARARDMDYPTPGQEHQSNIGEIPMTVD